MIKVRLVKKIEGVEVQNGDTITLGLKVGMAGARAYLSYLATTTDDPKLTEAEWSAGFVQLQSDWNQSDNTKKDFIKNKPTIPTNTSDLTNDSDFVSDAYYVHTDNNYDDAAVAEVAKIADKANSADVYTKSETYSQTEINNKLSAVYKFKGSVLTYDLLPIDAENADVWNVVNGITPELNGMNYAWNSTLSAWDAIGGIVGLATLTENGLMSKEDFKKLSDLYTKEDFDLILAGKSDIGHDHKGEIINPDAVVLDKQYTDTTMVDLPIGAIFYNVDQLCWLLKLSDVNYYNLGEELPMLCKNGDSFTHVEGTPVYISSGSGQLAVVQVTNSTIGKVNAIATQDVLSSGSGRGYYCFFGAVRKFHYANVIKSTDNENTWVDGASLYLCSESGKFSTVKEDAPARSAKIGVITNRDGANITIMFTPEPCYSIDDLCDVDGNDTTIADTDEVLKKDTAGLWKKVAWENVKVLLNNIYGRLETTNTWSLLQTFTSGLKTTKIIPNSDTTGVVIRNAADTADVVKVDTANGNVGIGISPSTGFHVYKNANPVATFERPSSNSASISVKNQVQTKYYGVSTDGNFAIGNAADLTQGIFQINLANDKVGLNIRTPETLFDVNGSTTMRDWVYLNNGTHTGDAVGDRRCKVVSGVETWQRCTVLNATRGSGTWVDEITIDATGKVLYSGAARKKWTKHTAQSITFTTGSTADNISTLQSGMDGNYMTIVEASGVPGTDCYVEFAGVQAFERCRILCAYVGTTSHQVLIQLYDWVAATWRTFDTVETNAFDSTNLQFQNHEFTVFDDTQYIGTGGDLGKVRVRLYHPITGNATHRFYIDELSLRQ